MKQAYLTALLGGWLALPGTTHAQQGQPAAQQGPLAALAAYAPAAASPKAVLSGPPQLPPPAAPDSTGPGAAPAGLAQLRQLHLPASGPATQPGAVPAARPALSVEELARVLPQAVCRQPAFLPDILAPATATALKSSPALLVLTLAPGAAGVPGGGATAGQRLQLRGPAGEVVVALARPVAAGSHTLIVRGAPGLAGKAVVVVGMEHAAVPTIDYETLALLGLSATQELAGQLAAVQQQLAGLQRQLAAARQLNGGLLLDHVELQDLRNQLRHLQAQQAASFSATHRRPTSGWLAD